MEIRSGSRGWKVSEAQVVGAAFFLFDAEDQSRQLMLCSARRNSEWSGFIARHTRSFAGQSAVIGNLATAPFRSCASHCPSGPMSPWKSSKATPCQHPCFALARNAGKEAAGWPLAGSAANGLARKSQVWVGPISPRQSPWPATKDGALAGALTREGDCQIRIWYCTAMEWQ